MVDKEDIFASMANYQVKMDGMIVIYGAEQFLAKILMNQLSIIKVKYLSEWSELGLRQTNGKLFLK